MKNIFALVFALILTLSLTACGGKEEAAPTETPSETPAETPVQETTVLNVAASSTPHAVILEQVVDDLAEQGIDLQIHEYGDYIVPNTAVPIWSAWAASTSSPWASMPVRPPRWRS